MHKLTEDQPEYIKIAAKMLDIDVDKIDIVHPMLIKQLNNISHYIKKVKPYGELLSTQSIASVITEYFEKEEMINNIMILKEKTSNLDDFGRFIERNPMED